MIGPKLSDDDLRRLGAAWFAAVRETNAQEAAEFAAWDKERRKWIYTGGGMLSGGGDCSDCGGGDCGGA